MINARANGSIETNATTKMSIDAQFNLFRTIVITGLGTFVGAVLGGVVGLFVYANSRNPSAHDGVYEFLFTGLPLPLTGAVAGPVHPAAIK